MWCSVEIRRTTRRYSLSVFSPTTLNHQDANIGALVMRHCISHIARSVRNSYSWSMCSSPPSVQNPHLPRIVILNVFLSSSKRCEDLICAGVPLWWYWRWCISVISIFEFLEVFGRSCVFICIDILLDHFATFGTMAKYAQEFQDLLWKSTQDWLTILFLEPLQFWLIQHDCDWIMIEHETWFNQQDSIMFLERNKLSTLLDYFD